jgi:hypothetical protein
MGGVLLNLLTKLNFDPNCVALHKIVGTFLKVNAVNTEHVERDRAFVIRR